MQKRQNWFQEAKTRFGMQVPWFFKIIIRIGLACTALGGTLLGFLALPNFQSSLPLATIGSNLCIIGAGSAFLAKFAVTNPQDLPNNQEDNNGTTN